MAKVLHLLSQKPGFTGSGVTLQSLIRLASEKGWRQKVSVGISRYDPDPAFTALDSNDIHPLKFETAELAFPVPGMSDVMPYLSTRFAGMTQSQLRTYREAFRKHIGKIVDDFKPDVIHSHHVWIMSALLREIAPGIPVVIHCHATGLRQMDLCPHLKDEVIRGCRCSDSFLVLHEDHAWQLETILAVEPSRIHDIGAGYNDEVFHNHHSNQRKSKSIIYVGKLSTAKGLPWLLRAFEKLLQSDMSLRLHIVGSGAGEESVKLSERIVEMQPAVQWHGQLEQAQLADLMRTCAVCVLPSFYEGLPLVLVEALACGCRLVATELSGITRHLSPRLGQWIELVPMPRLHTVDQPYEEDEDWFVARLKDSLTRALEKPPLQKDTEEISRRLLNFSWQAVFDRIEAVWRERSRVPKI